ncbi:MAG: L-aspartate oxidase, partial [Cyanobacteriota bacterium]
IREALPWLHRQRLICEQDSLWKTMQGQSPDVCFRIAPSQAPLLLLLHELRQRLVLAELLMEAALFREESRGGHYRTDAPSRQPFWQRHSRQEIGKAIHTDAVAQS